MVKILNKGESPPGGWQLTVPQTGQTLRAPFENALRTQVRRHLQANGYELPEDFDEWFEETACEESEHREPFCGPGLPPLPNFDQKLITPSKAKRFMRTALEFLKDRKVVNREEAERRAAICSQCPLAGVIGACWGCHAVYRQIKRLLENVELDLPEDKPFCLACGCLLKAKVWLPNETLDRAEEGDRPDYWEGCWREG